MKTDRDVDVLVLGSGAAGLTAALSARQNGAASVLIAEAEGLVGGSSRLSGGLTMGAGTRYQRALGIADDADALFYDYMTLNHWDVEPGLARRLADLSGPTVEWLGDLGVQITGRDRGLRLLHANFARIYEAYLPGWIIIVNREGRRFFNETAPYGITDGLLRGQGDMAYAVFDSAALAAASAAGVARYKQQIPGSSKKQSPHWNRDVIQQMVAAGRVRQADTAAALAAALDLPADELTGTVERYNAQVAAGEDADYLKDADFLEPIATPPFYGAELRPATVCHTGCGPRIDRDARVLDRTGRPVPGLFAAGECAGGIIGPAYVGSGNSYASCVVFGRVAGKSAAAAARAGLPVATEELSQVGDEQPRFLQRREVAPGRHLGPARDGIQPFRP